MKLSKTNQGAQAAAARIAEVAQLLYDKGWAEGGGGNLSVNVSEYYAGIDFDFRTYPVIPIKNTYKHIAGNYIFVSTKGSRMREMAVDAGSNLCLIKVAKSGDGFQILFEDADNTGIPTSELPAHLAIQNFLAQKGGKERAIVHTHAKKLIALTHIKNFKNSEMLNSILLRMHTETIYFLPEGVGYLGFEVPGSESLATGTLKALQDHKVVIWEKHGCLAVGADVHQAFDRIDMLDKAAEIYLDCKQAGFEPELLTDKQISEIKALLNGA